ncbi:MAG: MOFRL family protein [Bilophila wadsworthia]
MGTDGTDGPTDAAGGYAFSGDLARLRAIGLHPKESLDANDSYPLLLKAGTLLSTGPTRTNVHGYGHHAGQAEITGAENSF